MSAAQSAYQEALNAADLSRHYNSIANMYLDAMTNGVGSNVDNTLAYANANSLAFSAASAASSYAALASTATSTASSAATQGLINLASSNYSAASSAASAATVAASSAAEAANSAYLAMQYDKNNTAVTSAYAVASSTA